MFFSTNIKRNGKGPQGNFVFRRKRRKLQVELKHRLDLNPETDATLRQKRMRTAGKGVKFAFVFLLAVGLFSAGRIVVNEAFVKSERFQLRHFSVSTDGDLDSAQIISATGLQEGVNMLGVSLVKTREKLEALPQVKSARVARGIPGILFLEVKERKPVAWLECPDQGLEAKVAGYGCLIDAEGYALPSGEISEAHRLLPVIRVGKLDRVALGQRIEAGSVVDALKLLKAHQASKTSFAAQLERIDTTKGFALAAVYDTRVTVSFPTYDLDFQMTRLARVLAEATRQKWRLASVDLLVQQNVPVTLRAGSGSAVAQSSPVANSRRSIAQAN
jgi:hypothetical protein